MQSSDMTRWLRDGLDKNAFSIPIIYQKNSQAVSRQATKPFLHSEGAQLLFLFALRLLVVFIENNSKRLLILPQSFDGRLRWGLLLPDGSSTCPFFCKNKIFFLCYKENVKKHSFFIQFLVHLQNPVFAYKGKKQEKHFLMFAAGEDFGPYEPNRK